MNKNRMKVCIVSDDFAPHTKGGAGMVAVAHSRALVAHGQEVVVITSVQDATLAGSFVEDGMRIERIYSNYTPRWRSWISLYNPSTVSVIRRVLKEVRPDVVHAHNVHQYLSYWTLRLARQSGARVFLTAHDVMLFHYGKLKPTVLHSGDDAPMYDYRVSPWQQFVQYRFWYNPFRNIVIRCLLQNVDQIFAVSRALKEALNQNGISNTIVLHNGIGIGDWDTTPDKIAAFKEKHGFTGRKTMLFGGRISGLKGGNVLLAALRRVVLVEPTATLVLIGRRDAYVDSLEQQARVWGIGGNVLSIGWITGDDRAAAFHAADVVAVPSLYLDPFPTIVLEAMASGKAVVGSFFGGIPEMVADGVTGYVVDPCNEELFATRLTALLENPAKREAFGAAAYSRAAEFSLDHWVDEMLSAYQSEIRNVQTRS